VLTDAVAGAGRSWTATLDAARATLRRDDVDAEAIARLAAQVVDSADREALIDAIRALPEERVASDSRLAFALGYAELAAGATAEGVQWLTRAESALQHDQPLLAARIAFELGAVYVARGTVAPAEILLLDRERPTQPLGDIVHLRALIAEAMGDHAKAIELFRRVISTELEVLSPATKVLATINLAASVSHRDPSESVALTDLAIATLSGLQLHPRLRAPARNIRGYALICLGRLDDARHELECAAQDASACNYRRIARYASYNLALIDELEGAIDDAVARICDIRDSDADYLPDLVGWARLRLIWLNWLRGEGSRAEAGLAEARQDLRSMRYAETILFLRSLLDASKGRIRSALSGFESLRRAAALRGDSVTELALELRLAHLERTAGTDLRAAQHERNVLRILRDSTVRLSPNWWSREIVESFAASVEDPLRFVLLTPAHEPAACNGHERRISIGRDGKAFVGDAEATLSWQVGRTGSRVLRRLFERLCVAYPRAVAREELADALWPESEADAAIRNLYGAVNDLRKVLTDVPGVRVAAVPPGYALCCAPHVSVRHGR
jgi:tetratricopeptide (TPR) repeat protein